MEKPVRVLHMINSLHFGGSQAFIMSVYRNIDRTRLQFDFVVTPEEEKDLYEEVRKMGGRIFVCPKYTFINHFTYLKWWEHFFTEHPEYKIIHGHVRSTSAIYLSIAKKHGLTTMIGNFVSWMPISVMIKKWKLKPKSLKVSRKCVKLQRNFRQNSPMLE